MKYYLTHLRGLDRFIRNTYVNLPCAGRQTQKLLKLLILLRTTRDGRLTFQILIILEFVKKFLPPRDNSLKRLMTVLKKGKENL